MPVNVTDKKIAIIATSGFDENHMTAIQRALTQAKLSYQIIAPEQGLINGWQDNDWGHYFTVDQSINTALGSDYDALILLGGERSVNKLKTNLHARRIINHFLEAKKPVAAIADSVGLLTLSTAIANHKLAAPPALEETITTAQATLSSDKLTLDGGIITGTGEDIGAWVEAAVQLISTTETPLEEAA
jgi:protease I